MLKHSPLCSLTLLIFTVYTISDSRKMLLKLTLLVLPLLLATMATSPSSSSVCEDFLIPVNITSQRAVLDIEISDNWDVEDYIFNSTRRDSLTTFKPIIGEVKSSAEYRIGASFCAPKSKINATGTVLLLTHGSMTDRKYYIPFLVLLRKDVC